MECAAYTVEEVWMPTWTTISLFLLAALGLLFIPGPAVLFVMTRSVDQGRRVGAISSLGIGTADLIYLGVRTLLRRDEPRLTSRAEPKTLPRMFLQGMVVELLNPKTALFFLAFLPQFVDPARGTVPLQVLLFGSLYAVLGLCSLTFYGLVAGTAATLLRGSTRFQRIQRYVTGSIYIALGLTAAFAGSEKK
jgi:threonine/homoserine/homoserine lactone efflux protein